MRERAQRDDQRLPAGRPPARMGAWLDPMQRNRLSFRCGWSPCRTKAGIIDRRGAVRRGRRFCFWSRRTALHRLGSTEVWHFHAGDGVEHVQLDPVKGDVRVTRLGGDILRGETPQCVVPGGVWQGARWAHASDPTGSVGYALLGCTMAPAWDEALFELGERDALLGAFPAAANWIGALTR